MKKLLMMADTGTALEERLRALSPELEVVAARNEQEAARHIGDAEIFYGTITPELFHQARRLRWIQTPMAGLERYFFPELIASDVIVTNMRGIYSDNIADHVFSYILCFARNLHHYIRMQERRIWDKTPRPVIHLADTTLGIVGLGGIGYEVARRGHVCGMRVLAVDPRREDRPPEVAELWKPDRLDDLLAESDFVVVTVPQTPETTGLFDAARFARMKPTAYFINIGRGKVVRLDDLTEALQQGRIAGAGLDVFEIEPLPADHPLWGMENVIITPHVAGVGPHTSERRWSVVLENVRRYLAGEPLLNVVDKAAGY